MSHGASISVNKKMGHLCDMARHDPQFRIRLPGDLKAWLEESATLSRRSLNAEIVYLLMVARAKAGKEEFPGDKFSERYPMDFEESLLSNELLRKDVDRLLGKVEDLLREKKTKK